MEKRILFETSPWFILLCLLAGLGYAVLLYNRKNPWTRPKSYLLATGRFITVSALTFLLLGPLVRQISNTVIKPTLVIAVDNSESILKSTSSGFKDTLLQSISNFRNHISSDNYQIDLRSFGNKQLSSPENIQFDYTSTDLMELLNHIQSDYEGRNLAGVVLFSDGIYNQGMSPAYANLSFPVYTVGVGDTTEKKDIILRSLLHNKIVYQGNKFPVIAEIINHGFQNRNVEVSIFHNNHIVNTEKLHLNSNQDLEQVKFLVEATESGIQHYVVRTSILNGEFNKENNSRDAYIEVVEGKEKILLLAHAPHPDIKPLKKAIEKNENYELTTVIPGINEYKDDKYDMMILHQLPDRTNSLGNEIDKLLKKNVPVLYILGPATNISIFDEMNHILSIRAARHQFDNVLPSLNPEFDIFNIDTDIRNISADLPPVTVPYGEYALKGQSEILLYQQVGKIITSKPLLVISRNTSQKEAVLVGEGTWQWRLYEFKETGDFRGYDDLIGKTVQYLSAREDKSRFRVYPVKTEHWDVEPVIFETEIYNDIFEEIYGMKVDLNIRNDADSTVAYSYITSPGNTHFKVNGLPSGAYRYNASTRVNGELMTASGMFSVKEMQLESTDLTANFNLLRELSRRTGGNFYNFDESDKLYNNLEENKNPSMIQSSESYLAIINMKWIFFLLLIIITLEWGFRKYLGGY